MFEDVPSLSVLPFFSVEADFLHLPKNRTTFYTKEYLLPKTQNYLSEESFADVYAAWTEEKILFHIEAKTPFEKVDREFRKGDSVEIFIDTRDLKSRKFMTAFCHHLVFFPDEIDGIYAKEVTKFRTDDMHTLALPTDLNATTHIDRKSYVMDIEIPTDAMHSFRPNEFSRLGFNYRINRTDGEAQNFAFSSFEYAPETNPQLWGTLNLKK